MTTGAPVRRTAPTPAPGEIAVAWVDQELPVDPHAPVKGVVRLGLPDKT